MGSLRRIPLARIGLSLAGLALIAAPLVVRFLGKGFGFRLQTALVAGVCIVLGSAVLWVGPVRRRAQATYWVCLVFALVSGIVLAVWNVRHLATAASSAGFLLFVPSGLFIVAAIASVWRVWRGPVRERRRFLFQHVLAGALAIACLAGIEIVAGVLAPPWPARDLRPVRVTDAWARSAGGGFNSWGMRDVEHSVEKPEGTTRIVFIGDSFLEGIFSRNALAGYCRDALEERGRSELELVNLGIVATNPAHYLHRLRAVGIELEPDAVVVFLYMGNDMMLVPSGDRGLPFVAERPLPSVLGALMPRLTWLLVDWLNMSQLRSYTEPIPDEFAQLKRISELPYESGVAELARYMHRRYITDVPAERVEEILRKGGERFWHELRPREVDRQYLLGWRVATIIRRELVKERNGGVAPGRDQEATVNPMLVDATVSYVRQMAEDLAAIDVPMYVFLAPSADNMDPDYRRFWEPWYDGESNPRRAAHRRALFAEIEKLGLPVIDLAEVLEGIPNTHRKLDRHWNEKGHRIVAERVVEALLEWNGSK